VIDLRVQDDELKRLATAGVLVEKQLGTRGMTAVDGEIDAIVFHSCASRMTAAGAGLVWTEWSTHRELPTWSVRAA
jgi:hypothetical protein